MPDLITINGKELRRIFYRDEPVITLPMIDQLHERPADTAWQNFRNNKERFVEGEDYFVATYEEWHEILSDSEDLLNQENLRVQTSEENQEDSGTEQNGSKRGGYRGPMYLFTRQGYLLLVKSLNDDRAWEVQRMLVKHYFVARESLSSSQLAGLIQESVAMRKELEAMRQDSVKTKWLLGYVAEKTMMVAREVVRDYPVAKVQHPEGFIRVALIDGQAMVLASDFVTLHRGLPGNVAQFLEMNGLRRGTDYLSLTRSEIEVMYGVPADYVLHAIDMMHASKLIFITLKGMQQIQKIDSNFYDWYLGRALKEYPVLVRKWQALCEREARNE